MKFLNLLVLSLCFCACATTTGIKESAQTPNKIIPVFMANGQHRTALKTTLEAKGKSYNFLLLATKKDGYTNFKLIGDFAAILASLNLRENTFEYENVAENFPPQTITALEEILFALFAPNNHENLKYKYYFKKGENLPYKLKQKGQTNKTFLFEDYDGNIPQKITVKTKFNVVKINFELLAHD